MHQAARAVMLTATVLCCAGCAKQRLRALPAETMQYLSRQVDSYENPKTAERFADAAKKSTRLARKFKGALRPIHHAMMTHDPRLDAVAWIHAYAFGARDTAPANNLIRWTMWKMGIAAGKTYRRTFRAAGRVHKGWLDQILKETAREFDPDGTRYSFGVARVKVGTEKYGQTVVIAEKPVMLAPLPKHYRPGQKIILRGRLLVEADHLKVFMSSGGLFVLNLPVKLDNDRFLVEIPAPLTPGRYFLQFGIWRKPHWYDDSMMVPIYVYQKEPEQPDALVLDPPANPASPDLFGDLFLRQYNQERARAGIPPIQQDADLAEVAEEILYRDLDPNDYSRIFVARQLRERGISEHRWQTSRGRFDYAQEVIWQQLIEPWVRRKLLDDRFSKIGFAFSGCPSCKYARFRRVILMIRPGTEQVVFSPDVAQQLDPPVDRYTNEPDLARFPGPGPELARRAAELEQALQGGTDARVGHDTRLDLVARIFAQRGVVEGKLEPWLVWKLGLTGDIVYWQRYQVEDTGALPYVTLEMLNEINWSEENATKHYRFGLARVEQSWGAWLETVVLLEKEIELEPLKKSYAPGEDLRVSGRFLIEAERPVLYMDLSGPEVLALPLQTDRDGRFSVNLAAPLAPGRHLIELAVRPTEFSEKEQQVVFRKTTVLMAPIYVGQPAPQGFPPLVLGSPPQARDEQRLTERIRELYNEERARYQLPPLQVNPLADALLADSWYQAIERFDVPGLSEYADLLEENRGGVAVATQIDYVHSVDHLIWFKMLRPSFRRIVLDESVTMASFHLDQDLDYVEELWLSAGVEDRLDDKGRFRLTPLPSDQEQIPALGNLTPAEIADTVASGRRALEKCYNEPLDYLEDLAGELTLDIAVGLDGKVLAASTASSTLKHHRLEQCIADEVRTWRFPPPHREGVVVTKLRLALEADDKKGRVKLIPAK